MTYDGAWMRLYVDGQLDNSVAASGLTVAVAGGVMDVGNSTHHDNAYDGAVDELRIWSLARTEAQIQAAMNAELAPTTAGLVGYWRFNGDGTDLAAGNTLNASGTVSYESSLLTQAVRIANGGTDTGCTVGGGGTQYTITATAGAGGTISPSGAVLVDQGSSPTFTMAPALGYSVTNVDVDGTSVGAVSTWTIPNVQANHTISASFAMVPGGGGGGTAVPALTPWGLAILGLGLCFTGTRVFRR